MNAETGRLIWKTPVGKHNDHDNDSLLALEHKITLKAPYTILPGSLGGILTNMALAGTSLYVVTNDLALTYPTLNLPVPTKGASAASGEIEAINIVTGKVEWDTKVADLPLGAATVSNDLVFTTLLHGVLIALNRNTGAIVYRQQLPTTTNASIAIAGNTVLVPAGGLKTGKSKADMGGKPQLVAYTAP
jgi:outer membrane protein assembly factor BamB